MPGLMRKCQEARGFEVKRCATCGKLKPEDEYNWRNKSLGKKWGTCRECQRKQQADWYQRNKKKHKRRTYRQKSDRQQRAQDFVWDYLSTHPCVDCGESDPIVLEFDHVRGRKKKTLSKMVNHGYSISAIKKEISKCDVVCRNCHARRTHKQQGSWRDDR